MKIINSEQVMLTRNLFFLFSLTLFAIASLILSTFNYNPYQANTYQFAIFYLSFLGTLFGIAALLIFFLKTKVKKDKTYTKFFWPSVRQGVFISAAATTLLVLLGLRLLDAWIGFSLSFVFILLELFFQSKKPASKTDSLKH